jgi:hypothetical protein
MSKEKKKPPHHHAHHQRISGLFKHAIYSPKGMIEGILLDVDEQAVQIVIEPDDPLAESFAKLKPGVKLEVETEGEVHSRKGAAAHAVHHLHRLISVGGKAQQPEPAQQRVKGVVARFNYAKHGEPNGVVLDSGDFVHLKPHGMSASALEIGDPVEAEGAARAMVVGHRVIEATRINGKTVARKHPPH